MSIKPMVPTSCHNPMWKGRSCYTPVVPRVLGLTSPVGSRVPSFRQRSGPATTRQCSLGPRRAYEIILSDSRLFFHSMSQPISACRMNGTPGVLRHHDDRPEEHLIPIWTTTLERPSHTYHPCTHDHHCIRCTDAQRFGPSTTTLKKTPEYDDSVNPAYWVKAKRFRRLWYLSHKDEILGCFHIKEPS